MSTAVGPRATVKMTHFRKAPPPTTPSGATGATTPTTSKSTGRRPSTSTGTRAAGATTRPRPIMERAGPPLSAKHSTPSTPSSLPSPLTTHSVTSRPRHHFNCTATLPPRTRRPMDLRPAGPRPLTRPWVLVCPAFWTPTGSKPCTKWRRAGECPPLWSFGSHPSSTSRNRPRPRPHFNLVTATSSSWISTSKDSPRPFQSESFR